MDIQLGSKITIKGTEFVCQQISKWQSSDLARESSQLAKEYHTSRWPYRYYLAAQIDDFEVGDLISTEMERLQLWRTSREGASGYHPDCLVIYTKLVIKKENGNGLKGPESGN